MNKSKLPPVLDACCGSKMFWFDRDDNRALFQDKRRETHTLVDSSSKGGSRELVVDPQIIGDFTNMVFDDGSFSLVVFDPPHFIRNGSKGWIAKKYGTLTEDWREDLKSGFSECFRVLKTDGVLVFKWNEDEVSVTEILKLTDQKPLFGSKYGKHYKSHWIVFIK